MTITIMLKSVELSRCNNILQPVIITLIKYYLIVLNFLNIMYKFTNILT